MVESASITHTLDLAFTLVTIACSSIAKCPKCKESLGSENLERVPPKCCWELHRSCQQVARSWLLTYNSSQNSVSDWKLCLGRKRLDLCFVIYSVAMSLGNWFCTSRKGGTGGGGWYTQRAKTAWPCVGWLWKSLSRDIFSNFTCNWTYKAIISPCRVSIHCSRLI